MSNAVFTAKVDPSYDDLPEERYHFPATYLNAARQAVGDWIVYYEPRRNGGRQSYVAVAFVEEITEDPRLADHHYAWVSGYLEFQRPVPFREVTGRYYESILRKPDGSASKGAFGRSVRTVPALEFDAILAAGLGRELPDMVADVDYGPRRRVLRSRAVRDPLFASLVTKAYRSTCALTGLRLVNGGGATEVEAAHIQPVADRGPDSVRNGMALSRTIHWAFDRHLLALENDGRLLVSSKLPTDFRRLLRPEAVLPEDARLRPHPHYLGRHRELFKP
jgi:putative restriction endonuclease